MFKMFGSKDKKGKKEKENSKPSNLPPDLTPEERKEAEKLPFGGNTRLSKSKSGRYKVKNKQRGALDGDVYGTAGTVTTGNPSSSSSASQAGAQPSSSSSSSTYKGAGTPAGSSSYGQQQGSLGRSSGGHCGVANTASKGRYAATNTGISSQPTAV